MDHVAFLTAIVPSRYTVEVDADGIATVEVGSVLVAAWDGMGGSVTVAGYTFVGGKCRHLWRGPCTHDGAVEAATELLGDGLDVRVPDAPVPVPVPPARPLPPPTPGLEDLMDLFG
jgi:hypothetical protein